MIHKHGRSPMYWWAAFCLGKIMASCPKHKLYCVYNGKETNRAEETFL